MTKFKDEITKRFKNSEIFNIFKDNKRILLFLLENEIMIMDDYIVQTIITGKYLDAKYPQYFAPEIQTFMTKSWFPKINTSQNMKRIIEVQKKLPKNFNELRKKGENDSLICKMIQDDSIDEFKEYFEKDKFSVDNSKNKKESNNDDNEITLIKYAAFF
ncbi:hypothetical protein M9Y10_007096 [Tritrichomonas musculus]|uniref:Uncharacterized protein n=1 Tax=Tritrichomonas musculus TaxID=1915356 RepID=A0ABR2J2B6_9EUKA